MNDMTSVIVPKSDQINADDLIGGDMLITIRDVKITGGQEQPVSIYFEGSDKAFRPCKSMSRVLVSAWGADAKKYVGRSLQLYRDPSVKWGGMEVGGIRIRAMTDIQRDMTMALTATKGSRKPYTVKPLVIAATDRPAERADPALKWADAYIARLAEITKAGELEAFAESKMAKLVELAGARPDLHARVIAALTQRRGELQPAATTFDDDDFADPIQPSTDATPRADDAGPANEEPIAEAAPQTALQTKMEAIARGERSVDQGRDDSQMGEALSDQALADQLVSEAKSAPNLAAWETEMEPRYMTLSDDLRMFVDGEIAKVRGGLV